MSIRVFDFFSGCGGTSCGFAQAGMEIVLGIDIDPDAAKSFSANFPDSKFMLNDIRTLDTSALAPFMKDKKTPVLFCGCAPCQPFSLQNPNYNKEVSDKRSDLLQEFARFITVCLPDYIFIENVPGLQRISAESGPLYMFEKALNKLGYFHKSAVLPALWYGVPQKRERFMLLACRTKPIELPEPTHGPGRMHPYFTTVREWIAGLPEIVAGETSNQDPDHQAMALSPLNLQRIKATPEGGGRLDWPKRLYLECHKNHNGHTDVYGRLRWDAPASGLTTHCISYSNGRFGHPDQHRAISVREAACLQTFPRDYKFFGRMGSRARQIGNAVPPLMAQRIAEAIIRNASL
jgi:DNA (cytosine-5)-methyltransferase 1